MKYKITFPVQMEVETDVRDDAFDFAFYAHEFLAKNIDIIDRNIEATMDSMIQEDPVLTVVG